MFWHLCISCCGIVADPLRNVRVKECCEGVLWRSVVEKCCREVLEKSVGEECWGEVM